MTRENVRTPSSAGIRLSVVLPAYNEKDCIGRVIFQHIHALAAARDLVADWEILCVDDASVDGTSGILDRIASQNPRVRVLRHHKNQGIFPSFAEGFRAARGTHIYATAADGQWPAANILRMLAALRSGADLVVGVRLNRGEVYSLTRRFVSFAFNLLPRILFGIRTVDAGSIKLGVREVFQFPLLSRSPFAEAERILRAERCGFRVEFVPILFSSRQSGKATGAKLANVVSSLCDCLRCLRGYGIGRRSLPDADAGLTGRFAKGSLR